MRAASIALLSVMLFGIAACTFGGPEHPHSDEAVGPGAPIPPASCERTCNSEYDSCSERFSGVVGSGPSLGARTDEPNGSLGPNTVCPDQLNSCMKRCRAP